jgi:hypothetical protein
VSHAELKQGFTSGDCLTVGMDNPNLAQEIPRLIERQYREAVGPGSCLYDMANPRSTGKSDDVIRVPSNVKSTKDGSAHEWIIGIKFKLKKQFSSMMDSDPGWYAWGLNDLKEVKGVEYSIELTDPNPIFAQQYHLAHREQEFAETWVNKLENAGIVCEVESPFAAPVVVAPKKDEGGQWTDLRYAIDYKRLNVVTLRDRYLTSVREEILAKMDGDTLFTSMDAQKVFYQVAVAASTQPLLAFHSGNRLMT